VTAAGGWPTGCAGTREQEEGQGERNRGTQGGGYAGAHTKKDATALHRKRSARRLGLREDL
jgi:hypothetical protein